jgi:hypothetical protein
VYAQAGTVGMCDTTVSPWDRAWSRAPDVVAVSPVIGLGIHVLPAWRWPFMIIYRLIENQVVRPTFTDH